MNTHDLGNPLEDHVPQPRAEDRRQIGPLDAVTGTVRNLILAAGTHVGAAAFDLVRPGAPTRRALLAFPPMALHRFPFAEGDQVRLKGHDIWFQRAEGGFDYGYFAVRAASRPDQPLAMIFERPYHA